MGLPVERGVLDGGEAGCGTQVAATQAPPDKCAIGTDERKFVRGGVTRQKGIKRRLGKLVANDQPRASTLNRRSAQAVETGPARRD